MDDAHSARCQEQAIRVLPGSERVEGGYVRSLFRSVTWLVVLLWCALVWAALALAAVALLH